MPTILTYRRIKNHGIRYPKSIIALKWKFNISRGVMVRIVNVGFIVLVCSILMACVSGIPMSRAMSQCDNGQKFSAYASCIRATYDKQGRYPNDAVIKAFYANLDEINEAYKSGKLTEAQAKSSAYNAYLRTVDASNQQIKRAPYCVGLGNGDSVCS